jgi:hypothetical protein
MSKEHFWPLWLIDHAGAHHEGVRWVGNRSIDPRGATLPLCRECNNRLGAELEAPVSQILSRIEGGEGLSDIEAELLVRWLWKFEGLSAAYYFADRPDWRYSERWTPIQRVLEDSFQEIRPRLTLAIGLTHQNDPEFQDWPLGIDSGLSEHDVIFVSGVFGKTALMVSYARFDHLIPDCFGQYRLKPWAERSAQTSFVPPVCFPFSKDAINITKVASGPLKLAHEGFAREGLTTRAVEIVKPRVIIPG